MNMHPGDRRSIEENKEADLAKKEETTPIGHPRSSEMTKTPIHIEAEMGFLVGLLLISRFRRVLFVFAFGAVYAIAFLVFVGLLSVSKLIGRGLDGKRANLTWTRLERQSNGYAQYPSKTHESYYRMRSWIGLIQGGSVDKKAGFS